MAVRVLLEFDDEEEGRRFVRDVIAYGTKVYGIYKKPTQFCECIGGRKTSRAFTRGLNYGWWVCSVCMKPTKRWAQGEAWYTTLGSNLLPRSLRLIDDQCPERLESPKVWHFLVSSVENPDANA